MRRFLGVLTFVCASAALAGPDAGRPTVYEDNSVIAGGALRLDVRKDIASQVPAGWRAVATAAAARPDPYRLVKFAGPVGTRERQQLAAAGYTIVSYHAYNAFLVRATPGTEPTSLAAIDGVSWTGQFHPYFKVSELLAGAMARGEVAPLVVAEDGWGLRLAVRLHESDLRPDAEAAIAAAPGVLQVLPLTELPLRVQVDPARLDAFVQAVAALPEVAVIEPWFPRRPNNDENAQTGQSGSCQANGNESLNTVVFNKGITGWGSRLAVADSCADVNEGWWYDDALGRLPAHEPSSPFTSVPPDWQQRKLIEYYDMYSADTTLGCGNTPSSLHGTHVTGTVGANCSLNAEGIATQTNPANSNGDNDGMAPGAKLVMQDLGGDGLAYLNANGGTVGGLFNIAYFNTCLDADCGVDAHNNSWGADINIYDFDCETGDDALWNTQRGVIVTSAGNNGGAGYNTVGTPATAKNLIAVGNASDCQTDFMNGGSSRGDAPDKRLKPDVVAIGSAVDSAASDGSGPNSNGGCSTFNFAGTSMASPTVTGYAGLVLQYLNDGFYPGGAANALNNIDPSGPLLKALLINSGKRMTNSTTAEPNGVTWPNNVQGWGFVVLDSTLYFAGDARTLWLHDEVVGVDATENTSMTFRRKVTSSTEPLKVTLVWYDTAHDGSCGSTNPCLNNDLDLTVTNETSGATYTVTLVTTAVAGHEVPRTVVPSLPVGIGQSSIDNGPDDLNPIEQIIVYSPTVNDIYSFTVTAANTPDGPIPFALVATGALADPCTAPTGLPPSTAADTDTCANGGVLVSWSQDAGNWNDGGSGTRSYRVFRDGMPIRSGACAGNLPYGTTSCVDNTGPDNFAASYRVQYVSGCGSTAHTANTAATDLVDFFVDVLPDGTAIGCPGGPIDLDVTIDEPGSYTYQWTEDGNPIPGETSSTLSVTKPGVEQHEYNCLVTEASTCTSADVTPTLGSWVDSPAAMNFDAGEPPISTLVQICGDNDTNKEPGEVWTLQVTLMNDSLCNTAEDVTADVAVSGISAGAATVCNPSGAFGDAPPQAQVADGYTFEISEGASCPGNVWFDVNDILWNGGGPVSDQQAFGVSLAQCNVITTCSCTSILIPEVSPDGAAIPLTVEKDAGDTVKLTFQRLTAALNYNVYVSTDPSTLPFDVTTTGVGKKDCDVTWTSVLGGKAVIPLYAVEAGLPGNEVYYILVTGDKGPATEGPLGFTSDDTPREATLYCAD